MRPPGLRNVLLAIAVVVPVNAVLAAATNLDLAGGRLGAASVSITGCTSAGLSVLSNSSGSSVVSVTVASLPASCAGATLAVTVANGITMGSGSTTVPAGGGSVTVNLGSATAITTRLETDLVLVGP
jgi:hypothetical protein